MTDEHPILAEFLKLHSSNGNGPEFEKEYERLKKKINDALKAQDIKKKQKPFSDKISTRGNICAACGEDVNPDSFHDCKELEDSDLSKKVVKYNE